MSQAIAFCVGLVIGAGVFLVWLGITSTPEDFKKAGADLLKRKAKFPRQTARPDIRRIVLRPVNLDQPPSRVTQALFRQRPTRKLEDDDNPRT